MPIIRALLFFAFVMFLWVVTAKAADCPEGAKSCKVLVITPDQEEALRQLISNTGLSGPYNQVASLVQFYLDMLTKAPAGEVAKGKK